MSEWVADYGPTVALAVSVLGLVVAAAGFARSSRALSYAHPAILKAKVAGGPTHDEIGRPTLRLRIENTGPGVATHVRVAVSETFVDAEGRPQPKPPPVHVTGRLGVGDPIEAEIAASGDRLDLIEVQWRDSGGRHSTHPDPPPQVLFGWS